MSKQNIFETNQSTSRKTASMSMVSISSQEVVDYSFRDISSEKLAGKITLTLFLCQHKNSFANVIGWWNEKSRE